MENFLNFQNFCWMIRTQPISILKLFLLYPLINYPVDRSSLDNYNQIEAKWGRKPNDPFTGLGFSETKKAIFDDKLKARIDSFVLGAEARQIATVSDKNLI